MGTRSLLRLPAPSPTNGASFRQFLPHIPLETQRHYSCSGLHIADFVDLPTRPKYEYVLGLVGEVSNQQ